MEKDPYDFAKLDPKTLISLFERLKDFRYNPWPPKWEWYLYGERKLSLWQKIKLLLGQKLYVCFKSPNGKCNASCEIEILIRSKTPLDELKPSFGLK